MPYKPPVAQERIGTFFRVLDTMGANLYSLHNVVAVMLPPKQKSADAREAPDG